MQTTNFPFTVMCNNYVVARLNINTLPSLNFQKSSFIPLNIFFLKKFLLQVVLAQVVVYMARAPKSVAVYMAYEKAKACVKNHKGPLPSIPLHLRNAPTKLMKDLGFGKGYKYQPDYSEPGDQTYMPEELLHVNFFD